MANSKQNNLCRVVLIIFVVMLGYAGCKNPSPKVTVTSPHKELEGETTFKVFTDPNAPKRELEQNQSYERPKAKGKLLMPI